MFIYFVTILYLTSIYNCCTIIETVDQNTVHTIPILDDSTNYYFTITFNETVHYSLNKLVYYTNESCSFTNTILCTNSKFKPYLERNLLNDTELYNGVNSFTKYSFGSLCNIYTSPMNDTKITCPSYAVGARSTNYKIYNDCESHRESIVYVANIVYIRILENKKVVLKLDINSDKIYEDNLLENKYRASCQNPVYCTEGLYVPLTTLDIILLITACVVSCLCVCLIATFIVMTERKEFNRDEYEHIAK